MGTIILNINMDTILSELSQKSKIPINLSLLTFSGEFLLIDSLFDNLINEYGLSYLDNLEKEGYKNIQIGKQKKVLYSHISEKYGIYCFDILDVPSLFDLQNFFQIKFFFSMLFFLFSFFNINSLIFF